MKFFKTLVVLALLAAVGWAVWRYAVPHAAEAAARAEMPRYRTAPVMRSDVVRTVEATGTVAPIKEVEVGAQVNGRVIRLFADYNSIVTNGQIVALIDPQVYDAQLRSAVGQLHQREAEVRKCEAALALAEKTLVRKENLSKKDMAPVADYDAALEARDTAKAALESARAGVEQSVASVSQAQANLDYCTIVSPVNGVVIERAVDEGQTVVSSMNAVPLFTIAESLKTVQVEATVPEADVGSIRMGQIVTFTADAYRRKFHGKVKQIRLAATTTNNVVTYPVIIEAENPDILLFPGMTATLSIETARAENVPVVAAAALRFRPSEADRAKFGELPRGPKLWYLDESGALAYRVVETGVSDDSFTEVKNAEGLQAVVGYETAATKAADAEGASNPFMPKMPKHGTKGTAPEPAKK